ncbi:MAG: hypothetical protein QOG53_219 [Frankiales bacterium]|nr:hypothetical protein [Frankiales bacterium]
MSTVLGTRARWPRPTALHLDLGVRVSNRFDTEASAFGWEVWGGRITAEWDLDETDPDTLPSLGTITGWRGTVPDFEETALTLQVGQLERWLLRLDGEDVGNPAGATVDSPMTLWEAADAMSSDLTELVEALMGDDERLFCEDCYHITGYQEFDFDRLLILREIELLPQLRGHGIGAWASARSIGLLARDIGTLLTTMAAPLHREEFLIGPDPEERRDFTPAEDAAWHAAQARITDHWKRTIGLGPLRSHPNVLVGTVETAREALQASLDAWLDQS